LSTIPQTYNLAPQSGFITRLNFDIHHQLLTSKSSISQLALHPATNSKADGQLPMHIAQGYFSSSRAIDLLLRHSA